MRMAITCQAITPAVMSLSPSIRRREVRDRCLGLTARHDLRPRGQTVAAHDLDRRTGRAAAARVHRPAQDAILRHPRAQQRRDRRGDREHVVDLHRLRRLRHARPAHLRDMAGRSRGRPCTSRRPPDSARRQARHQRGLREEPEQRAAGEAGLAGRAPDRSPARTITPSPPRSMCACTRNWFGPRVAGGGRCASATCSSRSSGMSM